jgi:recombinational DNA repair protein RecT
MLDTMAKLAELNSLLTRMQKITSDLQRELPHDDAGWLQAAKDVLVSAKVPQRVGVPAPARESLESYCDICGDGPFKNELGLQIHQGRQHKKETKARHRAAVS